MRAADPARAGPRRRRRRSGGPGPTRWPTCSGCRSPRSASAPPPCAVGSSAAHDAARAADGLAPADWALDVDLDAVVEHLLAGQGDPPDPAALVEDRRRSVRRRSVVAGGAAAVAAGAVGWLAFARGPAAASGASASASRARPARPPPTTRAGAACRAGRLAVGSPPTPRVQGLVISRANGGGRLLWADDVMGQRVVVSSTLNPGTEDVILQAWQGAAGRGPGHPAGGAAAEPVRRRPARAPCRSPCRPHPAPCSSCWPGPPSPARSTPRPCAHPGRHHRPPLGVDGADGRHRGDPLGR